MREASTGPRSRERGWDLTRRGVVGDAVLQRDRAHVSADGPLWPLATRQRKLASTGPRSRERGWNKAPGSHTPACGCFNGTALT